MKLSDFDLCKLLDCRNLPNLHENDYIVGKSLKDVLGMDGQKTSIIPKRTQQEQLSHWHRNRRMLAYSTVGRW